MNQLDEATDLEIFKDKWDWTKKEKYKDIMLSCKML
jgi:hypothetical protein